MKKAAIDLGTNTFHLLVAEVNAKTIDNLIWKDRRYVFLAEDGLKELSEEVFKRSIDAVKAFREKLDELEVEEISVIGTEALRHARNGKELSKQLEAILNVPIQIISGDQEAFLIGKGVQLALSDQKPNAFVVDIGGGSTEIIHLINGEISSYLSQVCGIGYLYNEFHKEEPINSTQIASMREYIRSCYEAYLNDKLKTYPTTNTLIGVAGSFEVLDKLNSDASCSSDGAISQLPIDLVDRLLSNFMGLTWEERKNFPGLPVERSKYIIEALTIMSELMRLMNTQNLLISSFSIKHGVLTSDF